MNNSDELVNKKVKYLNLSFGKKDLDICQWVLSVPKGLFSYYVREAIKAHLNDDNSFTLPNFNKIANKIKPITKPISISQDTEDEKQVYDYLLSLDNHMRSFQVKQILRKYLLRGEIVVPELQNKQQINNVDFGTSNISSKNNIFVNTEQDKLLKWKSSINAQRNRSK